MNKIILPAKGYNCEVELLKGLGCDAKDIRIEDLCLPEMYDAKKYI